MHFVCHYSFIHYITFTLNTIKVNTLAPKKFKITFHSSSIIIHTCISYITLQSYNGIKDTQKLQRKICLLHHHVHTSCHENLHKFLRYMYMHLITSFTKPHSTHISYTFDSSFSEQISIQISHTLTKYLSHTHNCFT